MAPKRAASRNPTTEMSTWDCQLEGREGRTYFEVEEVGDETLYWELALVEGPDRFRRMWLEPSRATQLPGRDFWRLSQDKLTPAFEHSAPEPGLAVKEEGRTKRGRRSTGGHSARDSVEPSAAPHPASTKGELKTEVASSKSRPVKETRNEPTSSRRSSLRRSQSVAPAAPPSPVKPNVELAPISDDIPGPSHTRSGRVKTEPQEQPFQPLVHPLIDEPEALKKASDSVVLPSPFFEAAPFPPSSTAPKAHSTTPASKPAPPLPSEMGQQESFAIMPGLSRQEPPRPFLPVDAPSQPLPSPFRAALPTSPKLDVPSTSYLPPPPPPQPSLRATTSEKSPPTASNPLSPPSSVVSSSESTAPFADVVMQLPAPKDLAPFPADVLSSASLRPALDLASGLVPDAVLRSSTALKLPLEHSAFSIVASKITSPSTIPAAPEVAMKEVVASQEAVPFADEEVREQQQRLSNPFILGPRTSVSPSKSKPLESEMEPKDASQSDVAIVEETSQALQSTATDLLLPVVDAAAGPGSPLPSTFQQPVPYLSSEQAPPSTLAASTLKPSNPFGHIPSTSGSSTPLVLLNPAPSLFPSAPRDYVGESATDSSTFDGTPAVLGTPVGLESSVSSPMEEDDMNDDPTPAMTIPSSPAEAAPLRLPSFKRKSGSSAVSLQPKKAKTSPLPSSTEPSVALEKEASSSADEEPRTEKPFKKLEPVEEAKTEQPVKPATRLDKGKRRETPREEIKPTPVTVDVPPAACQKTTHPVRTQKAKARIMSDSEDSDMEEIATTSKPEIKEENKRDPSSSPLTEVAEDAPVVSAKAAKLPFKKKKQASKPDRVDLSSDEESGSSSSSGESSSSFDSPKKKKPPAVRNSTLKIKLAPAHPPSASSRAATPNLPSPAAFSSSRSKPNPSASSSSSSKLVKATSASSSSASKPSGSFQPAAKTSVASLLSNISGTSTSETASKKAGSSGTSTPSSSKPKPKPKLKVEASKDWFSSLLPGESALSKTSSAAKLQLSKQAKADAEWEEKVAIQRAKFMAEVDAETAKPLDIEAQFNVMRHFEAWQQNHYGADGNFLYPLINGQVYPDAMKYLESVRAETAANAGVPVVHERIPWPRNVIEAEDLDYAYIGEMEGHWNDDAMVREYLNNPANFPKGPGIN